MLLFEEFVPYEYRASLLAQDSKPTIRTRLSIPSLLSPSKKSKGWKPAPTINGRPYVVGTVPRSPNAREAEFERLLAGGGGAMTKVITLDSAAVGSTRLRPMDGTMTSGATAGGAGVTEEGLVRAGAPFPAVSKDKEAVSSPIGSNASPSTATSTPVKTSRFRFPVGSKSSRQGLFIPSEYDAVDFEARLASYSDDELNNADDSTVGRSGKAKAKRMSKDDAWVDILVASHEKRITNQDAEMRPITKNGVSGSGGGSGSVHRGLTVSGGSGGRSDPELASMEVAQALAAIRQHPPTDDEEEWEGKARRGEREKEREAKEAELERERERERQALRAPHVRVDDDEDELVPPVPRKRLGYFDLHPERRRGTGAGDLDVDLDVSMRSSDYAVSDHGAYNNSYYSEGDFEPADEADVTSSSVGVPGARRQADGDIEVPAFVDEEEREARRQERERDRVGQSKTAALIEMYQEKEKQKQSSLNEPSASAKPSRLPVRSTSAPGVPTSTAVTATAPVLAPVPSRSRSNPQAEDDDDDEIGGGRASPDDDPVAQHQTPFTISELGRASPMRYVHGAPLHNVLEEEEE